MGNYHDQFLGEHWGGDAPCLPDPGAFVGAFNDKIGAGMRRRWCDARSSKPLWVSLALARVGSIPIRPRIFSALEKPC